MTAEHAAGVGGEVEALRLAEESFRHSWDMSDERLIGGAWVAGLCCECGDFVPYGEEVAHVVAAFTPLIDRTRATAAEAALATARRLCCGDNPAPEHNARADHSQRMAFAEELARVVRGS